MKNKFKYLKPTFVLLMISIIVSGALVLTKHFTAAEAVTDPAEIIEQNRENYLEVLPGDENFEFIYHNTDFEDNTVGVPVEAVKSSVGYVITVHSSKQYSSQPIRILVGILNDGSVSSIKILRISETPGLGSNVQSKSFLEQFIGGSGFSLDGSFGTKINGVTSATKSSRAVTDAVNLALEEFARLSGGAE